MQNKLIIIKTVLSNRKNYLPLLIWVLYRSVVLPILLVLVLMEFVNNRLLDWIEFFQRFFINVANFLVDNAPKIDIKVIKK